MYWMLCYMIMNLGDCSIEAKRFDTREECIERLDDIYNLEFGERGDNFNEIAWCRPNGKKCTSYARSKHRKKCSDFRHFRKKAKESGFPSD